MQLMRHKDGQKVVVNETKKHGNGMKMWMIQLTKKGKHWNGGKIEEVKQCTWELKERPKRAVYIAKQDAQFEQFARINSNSDKSKIFKLAKRLKQENTDIVEEKCISNDEGKLALTVTENLQV